MRSLLALALLVGVLAVTASATAGGPPVPPLVSASGATTTLRHPNPLLTNPSLDYVSPIPAAGGGVASLEAPQMAAVKASVRDILYLEYERRDDLGGFLPAPLDMLALTGGFGKLAAGGGGAGTLGRCLGCLGVQAQIDLFRHQAGGKINSYTFLHGLGGPGSKPPSFPPIGPTPPPPGSVTTTPSANQCFAGCPKTHTHHHRRHHRRRRRHRRGRGGAGDCGTAGLSIRSNLRHCRIYVVNQAPGDGTVEKLTITNTSSSPYVLSLQATGTENALWGDLEMGVWKRGTAPPEPLPPLHLWTSGFNRIVRLAPGQTVHLTIELYLPDFAGNGDQNRKAVIGFLWHAQATAG